MSGAPRATEKSNAGADFFDALGEDEESSPRLRQHFLKPGRKIAGRYTLLARIGSGGMATIWEAEDTVLERFVAVKFLGQKYLDDPEYRLRFEAEATTALRLRSPFIVDVYDYGVAGETPFIAMERLYGEDLHERLGREKRLSLFAVAAIVKDAGAALEAAHRAGVIHRDLKPKNLFISSSPEGQRVGEVVKLLDFGVAKHAGSAAVLTATGVMLGSPFYMSPEQIHGHRDLDARTDLWSLAAIIYRAITGVKAFDGELSRVMFLITSERPRAPSRVAPHLSRTVDAFFEKAFARERDDRFQSAGELVDTFHDLIR